MFEVKVRYSRENADGYIGRVTESYIVNHDTCAAAEAFVLKVVEPFITPGQEVAVISVKETPYKEGEVIMSDEFNGHDHRWYKAKVMLILVDENRETKRPLQMLVEAENLIEAGKEAQRQADTYGSGHTLTAIQETNIMDVYLSPSYE
ncbi:MAG: DUF4494 family protein [Paludibacteraceae bacterium]|nr:DUF4494 family protein [Paludibacteraceae bacterium]